MKSYTPPPVYATSSFKKVYRKEKSFQENETYDYHEVAWEVSFLAAVEEFLAVVASYLQLVQLVDYPRKPVLVEEDYADI